MNMNILLVNPPRVDGISVIREERCEVTERFSILPPYSLLQIGALLRKDGHKVSLIDANGENIDYEKVKERILDIKPDIVVFRFTPTTFEHDMKTADVTKEIDSNIITAGICFTLRTLDNKVMQDAKNMDVYVRSEYEVVVPQLVEHIDKKAPLSEVVGITYRDKGEIKRNPDAKPLEDYNELPIPAYDLLDSFKHYFINTPVGQPFTIMYTSKGCPFKCIYCTVAGTKLKMRNAESVLNEIKYLKKSYNIKTISFFDETFTVDRERVVDICNGLIDNNIKITWYCNTRAHLVDDELLKLMHTAGCRGISFGIESGSQKILDNAHKGIRVEQAMEAIKLAKKNGIKVYTAFMLGLPGETWDTVKETIKFIKKSRPTSAQFNVTVPYPGTELYNIYRKEGKIGDIDWRDLYQHDSLIGTDEMSPEDLNKARKMAYKALYFNPLWLIGNIFHVFRHPEDFTMAYRYFRKIMKNYFVYKMEHSH